MNVAAGACSRVASQKVERAVGVDGEVGVRVRGRPVVRGLRGGVDDQLDRAPVAREERVDPLAVADVHLLPAEVLDLGGETVRGGRGGGLGAEEVGAHVVLDADHVEALLGEEAHRLRADEAARAGDDRDRHQEPASAALTTRSWS